MAQHMEVRNKKAPKILQKIGASIEKEVARGLSYTSMKWQRHESYPNIVWWETTRYIGKGIVWGMTRGTFEVHVRGRKAVHIFLVA